MSQEFHSRSPKASSVRTSRRNLPRASHACQRCRIKKAKCDQQKPCSVCVKHAALCEYGVARKPRQAVDHARSGTSPHVSGQDHMPGRAVLSPLQDDVPPQRQLERLSTGVSPQSFDTITVPDVVEAINEHTEGTEFYGTSSNFVLLNQLLALAHQSIPAGQDTVRRDLHAAQDLPPRFTDVEQSATPQSANHFTSLNSTNSLGSVGTQQRISVINILSNDEVLSPPSRPKTPLQGVAVQLPNDGVQIPQPRHQTHATEFDYRTVSSELTSHTAQKTSLPTESLTCQSPSYDHICGSARRLEREYVHIFLNNLHYLHPTIDPITFIQRCDKVIWSVNSPTISQQKQYRHFTALYYIVVAVGALIASASTTKTFQNDIKTCMDHLSPSTVSSSLPTSSQTLSRLYFQKSRKCLGDVFEVCSLESAQTLLLMSLYCQNSQKPHACYMLCGQAVRTALAIGLTTESSIQSIQERKAIRRTWWCIYSHEIDMSCSAGRRDSLGKPYNYQIPMPAIEGMADSLLDHTFIEQKQVAMVNEMVSFAAILRRVSRKLYHDSKNLTLLQKSVVATDLEVSLDAWKDQLPEWLQFDKTSLDNDEWATKQKLVLQLRYLNAKIVLHRPFLASSLNGDESDMSVHRTSCLDAARSTITVMHNAFTHYFYFRTWWYNSTYTLYAGMIILYTIMLSRIEVTYDDLIKDVLKARDILQSMGATTVARRSADLLQEGLDVAKECIRRRQQPNPTDQTMAQQPSQHNGLWNSEANTDHIGRNSNYDISRDLFTLTGDVMYSEPLLASLIDSNLLQDFTTGDDGLQDLNMPSIFFDDLYNDANPLA